jgi:thiol-disulfide isomerase/thioredoxin
MNVNKRKKRGNKIRGNANTTRLSVHDVAIEREAQTSRRVHPNPFENRPHLTTTTMILRTRPILPYRLLPPLRFPRTQSALFSSAAPRLGENRIFANVRTPDELHTLTFLSATDNRPLITMWTASWCTTCQAVKPLVRSLIEEEKVGEKEGGVGFVEVELDSVLIGDIGMRYMVCLNL